jgi:hypothetical protein
VAARPQGAGVRSGDGRSTRGLRVAPIVAVGILGVAAAAGVGAGSAATQGAIASDAADEAHFLQAVIRGEILKPAQLSELKNDYGGSYGPALQSSRMVANRPASPTATTAAALATRTASKYPPTAAASPSYSPTATPSPTAAPPRCAEPTSSSTRCSASTAPPHKAAALRDKEHSRRDSRELWNGLDATAQRAFSRSLRPRVLLVDRCDRLARAAKTVAFTSVGACRSRGSS